MSAKHFLSTFAATLIASCTYGSGATYTIKNGVADWTSAASYEENEKPSSGDYVHLRSGCAVTLDAADTDSWALVETLARIIPQGPTSKLTVNVTSGDATLTTPFSDCNKTETTTVTAADYSKGEFVKTGVGNLNLGTGGGRFNDASGNRCDYYCTVTVEAGTITLPQEVTTGGWFHYGKVSVSNGATIVIMKTAPAATTVWPNTCFRMLFGEGTLTSTGNRSLMVNGFRISEQSTFAGKLSGTLSWYQSGRVMLTGTESDATGDFNVYCH